MATSICKCGRKNNEYLIIGAVRSCSGCYDSNDKCWLKMCNLPRKSIYCKHHQEQYDKWSGGHESFQKSKI